MKLIIDIPEEVFECCLPYKDNIVMSNECNYLPEMTYSIANGTPLQKGHGDLMLLSKDKVKENQINLDFSCQKWISEVGLSNATVVIIEAESE